MSVVNGWLDNVAYAHSDSNNTRENYKAQLTFFCNFINCSPRGILEDYEKAENEREFKRKYAGLVRNWISQLHSKGYSSGTIQCYVASVKSFFKYNDLPLAYVPTAKTRITYHNRDIKCGEITDILQASRPRDRAFFCMMSQSGLRPDTLAKLRLKHLEPDFSRNTIPCKITVPEELTKGKYHDYFSFMGLESVKYLKAYLNTRGPLRHGEYVFTSYGTDKKVNTRSISNIFTITIEKLKAQGLMQFEQKKEGKPRTLHLYCLRKFFRKYASQAGNDYVQYWMGHTLGVDDHYFSRDVELHRKEYAEKAMPYLTLETETPGEMKTIIEQQSMELERLKKETEELRAQAVENVELKRRIQRTEKKLGDLERLIREALETAK